MHRAHPARSKVIQSSGRSGWRPADFARKRRPGSRVHPHTRKSEMPTYLPHVQRPRELELAPVLPAGLGAGSGSASEIVRRNVVKRLEKKRPGPASGEEEPLVRTHKRRVFAEGHERGTRGDVNRYQEIASWGRGVRNEGNSSSPETRRGLLQQQQHHQGATCACRDLIRDLCPSSVSKLREAAPRLDFRCTERIFMPPYDGRPLSSFLCARPPVLYSRQTSAGSLVNAITCFSHKRDVPGSGISGCCRDW